MAPASRGEAKDDWEHGYGWWWPACGCWVAICSCWPGQWATWWGDRGVARAAQQGQQVRVVGQEPGRCRSAARPLGVRWSGAGAWAGAVPRGVAHSCGWVWGRVWDQGLGEWGGRGWARLALVFFLVVGPGLGYASMYLCNSLGPALLRRGCGWRG